LLNCQKKKSPCFTIATDALKLAIEEYRCKLAGVHEKGGFDSKQMETEAEGIYDER